MAKRSRGGPYIINIFCRQIEKKIRLSKQEEELKRLKLFDASKSKQLFLNIETWINLKYRQAKSVFLKMNCQFKVVSVKLQSAVVFQWVKEVKNYANRLFSSREVFDKKVCIYFFSKWKNKIFISQFYKKKLPFRRRKKPHRAGIKFGKTHYHHIPWLV